MKTIVKKTITFETKRYDFDNEFSYIELWQNSTLKDCYFVEKEYEKYAKDIFGETPNMIAFFEKKLGVSYPWDKYHQVVVRDFVSGAMENTGAVIFGDFVYKTDKELLEELCTQYNTERFVTDYVNDWAG